MAQYERVVFNNKICVAGEPLEPSDTVDVKLRCGTTATLTVVSVVADGRGFTYDRATGSNNNLVVFADDIDFIMPDYECPACADLEESPSSPSSPEESPSPSPSTSPT